MKTTSEHISKQLAEIGFEAETSALYRKEDGEFFLTRPDFYKDWEIETRFVRAYFLETILDALPKRLQFHGDNKEDLKTWFLGIKTIFQKWQIMYMDYDCKCVDLGVSNQENESLADTAARLLILLESEKLISFK